MKELSFHTKTTLTHLFHCEIVGQFGLSFFSFFNFVFILYLLVYHFHIATLHSMQKIKQRCLKFIDDGDVRGRGNSSMSVTWINWSDFTLCVRTFGAHILNVMKQCFDRFCFDSNAYENKYNIIRHCCKSRATSTRAQVYVILEWSRTTKKCCCCRDTGAVVVAAAAIAGGGDGVVAAVTSQPSHNYLKSCTLWKLAHWLKSNIN